MQMINLEDEDSRTLLSWNIRQSFTPLELLEKLILNGANVNQIERYGITPLMIAAKYGYDDKAKILLENNANINLKDAHGRTAIDITSESGAVRVQDLIVSKREGTFVETLRYKDLDWYIINETDREKLLLLRDVFTKEMIQKYFDMYDRNFNVKFNLDIRKAWWEESYIRQILNERFILDLDKKDLNVMKSLVTTRSQTQIVDDYVRLLTIEEVVRLKRLEKQVLYTNKKAGYYTMSTFNNYNKDSYVYYVDGEILGEDFRSLSNVPRAIRSVISLKK